METLVGIFRSRRAAEEAVHGLRAVGLTHEAISFLAPDRSSDDLSSVPTTDAESPGIGKTISGYVGGVVGASAGLGLGSAIAGLMVPGVGPVVAIGIGAAALLGAGGAVVGSAVGEASEKALDQGVPADDVLFYRELLRQGRSLVVVSVENDESAAAARAVLHQHDAEDVGHARAQWEAQRPNQAA